MLVDPTPIAKDVADDDGCRYIRRVTPYRTKDNCIEGAVITFVDITERKRIEQVLRESEERFSAVVRQARDGIVLIQDKLILFANQALADILGYTPEEMERTPFIHYIAPESRELVAESGYAPERGKPASGIRGQTLETRRGDRGRGAVRWGYPASWQANRCGSRPRHH